MASLLHDSCCRLPINLYQAEKISKLLLMMEKGSVPVEHKGKTLTDVDIDVNLKYA